MAKKKTARKAPRKSAPALNRRKSTTQARPKKASARLAPVKGAELREVGHVRLEVGRAGAARVKRMVYPPGFRWSVDMKPIVGTDLCMHAHVGFLARGTFEVEYGDGCTQRYTAPAVIAIEPGHDGRTIGDEPVVLIQFDFERESGEKLGLQEHSHA